MYHWYESMSFASRAIDGTENLREDFPLYVLEESKEIFDLRNIPDIRQELNTVVAFFERNNRRRKKQSG